jgi:pimeloyl-ACP methyl ester carboxylesterase
MTRKIPEMLTKGREREYIKAQIRSWSYQEDAVAEKAISEFARHYASPGGTTAGFNYYRTLREDAELAASLSNRTLGMSILAIGGRHGVGTRLADALGNQSSQLAAVIAENSGHFVAEEAPDFFRDQVERFLTA